MSCKCQACGRQYKLDLGIPNDLWEKISPKKNGAGMLCGACICLRLEKLLGYSIMFLSKKI